MSKKVLVKEIEHLLNYCEHFVSISPDLRGINKICGLVNLNNFFINNKEIDLIIVNFRNLSIVSYHLDISCFLLRLVCVFKTIITVLIIYIISSLSSGKSTYNYSGSRELG